MSSKQKNSVAFGATIVAIGIIAAVVYNASKNTAASPAATAKEPTPVSVTRADQLRTYTYTAHYPATVAGQNQATVAARAAGTVQSAHFDVGRTVAAGQRLATIDLTGGFSDPGKFGLESGQIRSMELAVENAEDAYKQAKRLYKEDRSYRNKKNKDIAKNNWLSAEAGLQSALDSQYVTAPIAGTIVKKAVSVGDSVAPGQVIAVISKTNNVKVTFHVSADELKHITKGQTVTIHADKDTFAGTVSVIAPEADPTTKRFLVEATPTTKETLPVGSLVSIDVEITQSASDTGHYVVPLSVLTIGQNDTTLFVAVGDTAEKVPVVVRAITGETAEISSEHITDATHIIFDGSKLLHQGDPIARR